MSKRKRCDLLKDEDSSHMRESTKVQEEDT